MSNNRLLIILIALLIGHVGMLKAQDCEFSLSVIDNPHSDHLSVEAKNILNGTLERIITQSGFGSVPTFTQFVLMAQVVILDTNILPGPPMTVSSTYGITLFLGDIINKQKYASTYLELAGVGNNDTKSSINAFRRLSRNNSQINHFLQEGKSKILKYYNTNYPNILRDAKRMAGMQDYEKAIALLCAIPSCSAGGKQALQESLNIYQKYRDSYNLKLLNQAKALWNTSQDKEGAKQAGILLSHIDPESSSYRMAIKLSDDIKNKVRTDTDFILKEKYKDDVKIKQQTIDAIRQIGVAYGKGQQEHTTNMNWLH